MRYCNIFRKSCEEYDRYWMSVSTEKLDKNGKGTGEYVRASISASLSNAAKEIFADNCVKTKSKDTKQGCFEVTDCFFKAIEHREGDPSVIVFINKMKPEEE